MNWLIAEDEADIRNLVSMMCTVWGHTPITFETGQKVWDWMDKIEAGQTPGPMPNFALMDIRMPGRRGNEIAARMRTLTPLKNIPIVLMTAFALSDEEMRNMRDEFGVDHIINKPLPDFDKLRNMLNDIITKKAASVPKEEPPKPPAAPTPAAAAPTPPPATPATPTAPSTPAPTTPAAPSTPTSTTPTAPTTPAAPATPAASPNVEPPTRPSGSASTPTVPPTPATPPTQPTPTVPTPPSTGDKKP